jgi:hypothetical protein
MVLQGHVCGRSQAPQRRDLMEVSEGLDDKKQF